MRVFWIPARDGEYKDLEAKELQKIPDAKAYARAGKAYPDSPDYVEEMLDGRGYIDIPAADGQGKFRYLQE
jgi:hypothetical protein